MADEKIIEKYLNGKVDDSILEYGVQDIIVLYAEILKSLEKNPDDEAMKERKQSCFKAAIMRFIRCETVYIAYHVITGYPYIDIRGHAWMFSEKDFSDQARHHYMEQGIPLTMKKIEGYEKIADIILELSRVGAQTVIFDNGQRSITVVLEDMMTAAGIEGALAPAHPDLFVNILASMELSYASGGKHPALPEGDKVIRKLIEEAHLLVPVKLERHLEDGETMKITSETSSQLALVNPLKKGKGLIAAFTDWREFEKLYSKDEWNAVIFDYNAIKDAASNVDGFMINPAGFMFTVPNETE